jgi:ElaA protein
MSAGRTMNWAWCSFDELTPTALYELLQLRSEVFVVEQNCVFLDLDGSDAVALHLLGREEGGDGTLLAYARFFQPGVKFPEASIGRVTTRPSARGNGLGHELITEAVAALCKHWGPQPIRIGAQARLEKYYTRHGFVDVGKPYMEDGIEHIEMLWTP